MGVSCCEYINVFQCGTRPAWQINKGVWGMLRDGGVVDAAWEAVANVVSEDEDEYAQLTRRFEAIGATTPEPSGEKPSAICMPHGTPPTVLSRFHSQCFFGC
jgi:hypothetical protein